MSFEERRVINMKKNSFDTKNKRISGNSGLYWKEHALIHLMGGMHSIGALEKSTSDHRTEIQKNGEKKV